MRFFLKLTAALALLLAPRAAARDLPLDSIRLPSGFRIEAFAEDVPGARSMVFGERGTLFVGTRREGRVYALVDRDGDHRVDDVHVIASGLEMPNGVAFRAGALYVAEVSRILRYDGIEGRLTAPPEPVVVRDDYPTDRSHGWKYIAFGPDDRLYVPIGAPCNVCLRSDERYGTITRIEPDGADFEIFARGVRNTVGFDWQPGTNDLWFTDNGRDWLGDDLPPDELNRATRGGLDFGFPYVHGRDVIDPEYGQGRAPREFTLPVQELGPHVAALGMKFYDGAMFPESYRGQIFIAEHGSWNRSVPIGYRVSLVRLDSRGRATSYEVFAEGWLQDGDVLGRPVDVLIMADGSLLVSDDRAGAVYRISYREGSR
jgi:glucose/arabinose dehydrogenase